MRLEKALEFSGYFWLPSKPDSRLPGTLRIDDSGSCTLEVLGLFHPHDEEGHPFVALSSNPAPLPRISGLVEGGFVTLERCSYKNRNISFGGVSKSTLHVDVALHGCSYDEDELIRLNRADITIEGLDDWLDTSGLRVEFNWQDKNAAIHYTPPKESRLELPGMSVTFSFIWQLPAKPSLTEAKITQAAVMSAASAMPWSLDDLFRVSNRLTNFLCFAIDKPVSIKSMTVYSDDVVMEIDEGKQKPVPLRLYYRSLPSGEKQTITPDEMLFRFTDAPDALEDALGAWMANYDVLSPAISLFLSTKSGAHRFIDSQFLALAQAAETLHRRTSQESLMPADVFANLLKTVVDGCPPEHTEWLESRLTYANELPLRVRLKKLIKPFNHHYGNEAARSSFIKKVCDTRNYLTHYDEKLSSKAAKGAALVALTMKLDCLLQLQLLKLVGMPPEKIDEFAGRDAFKRRMRPEFLSDAES